MTRKPLIAGNWKMNKTTVEAASLSQDIAYNYHDSLDDADIVLCPPFIDLKTVNTVLTFDHSKIKLGAQDVYWEKPGPYTGAIAPNMLKEVGCSYCIVGHSERREFFGETDQDINRKIRALLEVGIRPIVCCGENLELREAGEALAFVVSQVKAALADIPAALAKTLALAYEPIWAIGTGRTATPEAAEEVCCALRACLAQRYGADVADQIRILYGGSLKAENAAHFSPQPNIDGGLIGGAALDARNFIDLAKAFV
ncbi:MAG: triose-phosphate isomerase [Coriobacteriales bacterium]|jgi:triosephosphate isomerase|nr:triose-phosphate isomerase [Coriobacteriales bacterium]